jgi:hypothetical protein
VGGFTTNSNLIGKISTSREQAGLGVDKINTDISLSTEILPNNAKKIIFS